MEKNRFMDMSDGALEKVLKDYSQVRRREIANFAYAAAVMIAVLSGRVKILQEQEDDLK